MTKILRIFVFTNMFIAISFVCSAQTVIGVSEMSNTAISNYNCPRGQVFFYDPVHRTGYCGVSSHYPYGNMYVSRTGMEPSVIYSDSYTRRNRKTCSTYVYSTQQKQTYCRNSIEVNPSYVYESLNYGYYGQVDPYPYLREERAIKNSPRCPAGYLYIPASNLCASPNAPVIMN